jgi:hypothetical protein
MFDVTWATEEPPSYQACEADLRRTDGTIGTYPFGLSVGPGQAVVLLTDEFAGAIPLDLSCHPYRTPSSRTSTMNRADEEPGSSACSVY